MDHVQLVAETVLDLRGDPVVAPVQTFPAHATEAVIRALAVGDERQLRKIQAPENELEVTLLGHSHRVAERLRQLRPEQPVHLLRAFEIVLARVHLQPIRVVDERVRLNAQQQILGG